jgi:excisionase family DNA binding protein
MVVDVRSKDVLNAEEAAEFLGFNPYTIREKARLGEIPGRKAGREWRFSRRQLLAWVEEGSRPKAPA